MTVAIALTAISGIAIYLLRPNAEQAALPKLADLKAIALDECLCAMAGEGDCGNRLSKASDGLEQREESESSAPMAPIDVCFPQLGNGCATRRWYFVNGDDEDFVCTNAQRDELERLFGSPETGPDTKRADLAVRDRIRSMREEVRRQRQK